MNPSNTILYFIVCFLFFNMSAFSQDISPNKFNLNFDTIDSTSNLPKGWFKWGYYDINAVKLEGSTNNFVGQVTSVKKNNKFGCIGYRIPANYAGDSITLSGYMKIENVKKGAAGLIMRIDGYGKNEVLAFDNMSEQNISGTINWQKHSITLPLSNKARIIQIGGFVSGKGKAWFDNFVVSIDGQDIQKLKEVEKPTLTKGNKIQIKNSIEKHRKILEFTTEKSLHKSLTPLIESIGDKKIVSLGEDTHGTSEFYKLREAITKKLILEKGYNIVILENPYDDIELLTKNIQRIDIDSLMRKHLFSIYQTQEMRSFLDWYKSASLTNNVSFKGCDDSLWVLPSLLESDLSVINDERLMELFDDFNKKATLNFEEYSKKHSGSKENPKNEYELGKLAYDAISAIEKYLVSKNLLTKKRKELLFNAKNSYINYVNVTSKKGFQSRDEIMADRISYLAQDPDAKIIVWAHNAHISNSVIIDNEIGIMGRDLRQEFGDDYYSIGMSSINGSYSYMENRFINDDHNYDDTLIKGELIYQPKNSWENVFNQINDNAYYFNTIDLKQELRNSTILGSLKLIGYGKEEKTDYYTLAPTTMFNTLIFVKNTTATNPLFNNN